MNLYAVAGFVIGFVLGMILNAYLLRNVPRDHYMKDSSLRMRYGLLNWAIAIIGMMVGLSV